MELGIATFRDLIESLAQFFGALAIILAAYTYILKRKLNYFNVITNCINKFQSEFVGNSAFEENKIAKYLDLVNEQLFYMENDYLPLDISVEWIDGIIDYLPIRVNNNQYFLNHKTEFKRELNSDELYLYPRIRHSFSIRSIQVNSNIVEEKGAIKIIDMVSENLAMRKQIIEELICNIVTRNSVMNTILIKDIRLKLRTRKF